MKHTSKLLLLLAAVLAPLALYAAEQITVNAGGLSITEKAADRVGFHGTAPTAQRSASAQAAVGAQTGYLTVASLKAPPITVGHNNTGAVTATSLAVGDTVIRVTNLTDLSDVTSSFEATVTVVNQLQQSSASDLSAKKLLIIAAANSTTDVAALKALVNELRTALVNKGLIKGSS